MSLSLIWFSALVGTVLTFKKYLIGHDFYRFFSKWSLFSTLHYNTITSQTYKIQRQNFSIHVKKEIGLQIQGY